MKEARGAPAHSSPRDPLPTALAVVLAAVLVAATTAPPGWNAAWGLNLWGLQPWSYGAMALLAGLAALGAAGRIPPPPPRWIALGALLLVAGWALFPAATLLFGDASDVLESVITGRGATPRSPLYAFLVERVHEAGLGREPEAALRTLAGISAACGAGFLLLLARAWRPSGGWEPAAAGVMLGGYLCIFQGYVEAYAPFVVLLAAYLTVLHRPPTPRRRVLLAALQVAAYAAHTLALGLAPLTLAYLLPPRSWRRRSAILSVLGLATVAAAAFLFAGRLPARFRLLDPAEAIGLVGRVLAGIATPRPWTPDGGILGFRHALDGINGMLLAAGPAFAVAAALAASGRGRRALLATARTRLGAAALLFLALRGLIATPLGAVLDWDLFACFTIPFTLAVLVAWGRPEFRAERRRFGLPVLIVAALMLIPWMLALHDPAAARRRVEAVITGVPAPNTYVASHAAHRLGDEFARLGRSREAARAFERAHALHARPLYARRAGAAWLAAGVRDSAGAALDAAIRLDPADLVSLDMRALLRLQTGDRAGAASDYRRMIQVDASYPAGWFGLGMLAFQVGDVAEAARAYDRAVPALRTRLQADPADVAARRKLIIALLGTDRPGEALQQSDAFLARGGAEPSDWYYRGLAELQLGRGLEGRTSMEQALALSPDEPRLLASAATAVSRAGDPEGAIAMLDRALARRDSPEVRLLRAAELSRRGDLPGARRDLEAALRLDPRSRAARAALDSLDAASR